jgi:hypothetical protein
MKYSVLLKTAASVMLAAMLTACGGGSDPAPVAEAPPPTTFTIAGTAATGAALDNATITIIDANGDSYPAAGEDPVVTLADGSYTVTLPLTAKPPFVVQAVRDDISLVSVVAEAKDTTTNITPVTNLIASRLSASGDPAKLADEIRADPTLVDLAKLTAKVAEIVALIQPLMDAVGDTTDPLNGNIQAAVDAGTGADTLLDSLAISITPSSDSTVNIEVAVKQQQAVGEQPVTVTFTGGSGATTPVPLPAVNAENLVPSGNAALIADFLQRMTACYALPQAERVSSGGKTAADIVASACLDVFFGNDPSNFLNNGVKVGSPGAFAGIFGTSTGTTFDRGSYEFTRTNGDLVIAFRATSSEGNSSNIVLVLRTDTDTKLRAIGNQYKYNGSVNAFHQLRSFINQPEATYYGSGYNLSVANVVDAGASIFDRVEVTSPKGSILTLKPRTGYSNLVLMKGTGLTGSSVIRLRGAYTDPANSAKNPAEADTGILFASPQWTDAEIAAIPAQGTWKFDYYLAGNTGTTPDETQYYKTRARALTIAELQAHPLATLTDENLAAIKDGSLDNGNGGKYLPTPATGPVTLNWDVPAGAVAPTSIIVYGAGFNDSLTVASSSRTGDILCSGDISTGDTHCADSAGNFASGPLFFIQLWGNDAVGREFSSGYNVNTITIP